MGNTEGITTACEYLGLVNESWIQLIGRGHIFFNNPRVFVSPSARRERPGSATNLTIRSSITFDPSHTTMFQRRSPSASPSSVTTTSADAEMGQKSPTKRRLRKSSQMKRSTNTILSFAVVVAGLCLVGVASVLWSRGNDKNDASSRTLLSVAQDTSSKHDAALYQCPAVAQQDDKAINFDPIRFRNHYLKEDAHTAELEEFVANFRDTPYDDWGQTYTHMKDGMTQWKQRAFVPHIQSGDKIYESAIGMGLNAYMTLELLSQEKPSLHDVTLYGNEYLLTVRANEFFDRMLPAVNVHKGNICVGDSTNISYVPSDSFDLVYTGYIL